MTKFQNFLHMQTQSYDNGYESITNTFFVFYLHAHNFIIFGFTIPKFFLQFCQHIFFVKKNFTPHKPKMTKILEFEKYKWMKNISKKLLFWLKSCFFIIFRIFSWYTIKMLFNVCFSHNLLEKKTFFYPETKHKKKHWIWKFQVRCYFYSIFGLIYKSQNSKISSFLVCGSKPNFWYIYTCKKHFKISELHYTHKWPKKIRFIKKFSIFSNFNQDFWNLKYLFFLSFLVCG